MSTHRCPHCNNSLTASQIVTLMHGSGFAWNVRVRSADGSVAWVEIGDVNPNTMEVIGDRGDALPSEINTGGH